MKEKVERHVQLLCFLLGCVYLGHEVADGCTEVLLLDHVEADHHFRILLGLEVLVDLLLDVRLAEGFETAGNDLHLKKWEGLLDLGLYFFEDGYFPLD